MDDTGEERVDDQTVKGSVPAGGAGADSGSVEAVQIDESDAAPIQNVSTQNDIPGVGTRAADGGMERGGGDKR